MSCSEASGFGLAAMGAFSLPGPKPETPAAPEPRPAPVAATIAGIDARLDHSGALYWPAQRTLVVSDLHLETGSSYARTGQMLPPYDSAVTLARLNEVVAHYAPARVIALGDAFHDRAGAARLPADGRAMLQALAAAAETIWITGNHDADCAAVFGGRACDTFVLGGVLFQHIPANRALGAGEREVAGHLHPAARIRIRGRTIKRRAFIGCSHRLVMPAFGCLTGGLPTTDPAFTPLWAGGAPHQVHLIGRARVYPMTRAISAPTAA